MKKLISATLAASLALSLAACGSSASTDSVAASSEAASTESTAASSEAAESTAETSELAGTTLKVAASPKNSRNRHSKYKPRESKTYI